MLALAVGAWETGGAVIQTLSSKARYGFGAVLAVAPILTQLGVMHLTGHSMRFLLVLPCVCLSAMLLGAGPSILGFVAGLVFGLVVPSSGGWVSLVAYGIGGPMFIAIGSAYRRMHRHTAQVERRLSEEGLKAANSAREKDARFSAVVESSPIPFSILAPIRIDCRLVDFQLIYVNLAAAQLLGRSVESLIGRPIEEALPGSWETPGLLERYGAILESGMSQTFELEFSNDAVSGWFHVVASPIGASLALWYTDITERKESELALVKSDKQKDAFLATLAHELRNPLAPIRQAAALFTFDNATEHQRRWSANVIERQVGNMALLLDDLLDASRISRGVLVLRKAPVELVTVLEAALETARPLIDAKHLAVALDVPPHPVRLNADALRVSQIVSNLLTNAAKYTDPGGRIALAARVCAGHVRIDVTDSGIGIAPSDIDRIFQMFTQVHATAERSDGGLGIGLALARGLAELHGGTLSATSPGVGAGSTFTLQLPSDCLIESTPEESQAPAGAGRSMQVLIVDDNRDAADTLAALVRLQGHEVAVAYDGQEALSAIEAFSPAVAIVDLNMPRMTGLELARRLRSSLGNSVTLVALTGFGQDGNRHHARSAGFDHHVMKPASSEDIQRLLMQA